MPWDEQTLLVGQALGREDRAQQVVDRVKARFEKFRTEHPEFDGKTAILAYGGPDGYGAYATRTRAAASSPTSASRPPRRSTSSPARASSPSSARSSSG